MMSEKVIVTQIKISKAGQIRFFQMKLPSDTIHLVGIEAGVRITKLSSRAGQPVKTVNEVFRKQTMTGTIMPFVRNTSLGEFKLQSCEQANIFYVGQIRMEENLGFADFSKTEAWNPQTFSHGSKTEEDRVIVDGESTILQGMYKDTFGEMNKTDVEYIVSIYGWVKIRQTQTDKKENR